MLQALPGKLAAAQVSAWRLLPAAAGCVALVYAATYITRVEKRLPLVYYKGHRKVRRSAPHICTRLISNASWLQLPPLDSSCE